MHQKSSSGKWIYDPFMGTGSMAYVRTFLLFLHIPPLKFATQPTAHFGAVVFGSDIDGRQMRGKG
jgi:tRNA (guanine10-N2)-methyltransferase